MASIIYPANLPAPLVSQNKISNQQATRIQNVSGGPPLVELYSSDVTSSHQCSFSFSEVQYQVFDQWFEWSLVNGSKIASMPIKTAIGFDNYDCILVNPQSQQNGKRWIVAAVIIILRKPKMTQDDAESLLVAFDGFEDLNAAVTLLEQAVDAGEVN